MVAGDLGVERRGEQVRLPDRDDPTHRRPRGHAWRRPRRRAPTFSTQGARMNTAWNGVVEPGRRRGRPRRSRPGGRTRCGAPTTSSPPSVSWSGDAALDPVGQHDHPGAGAERRQPAAQSRRAAARTGRRRGPACTSWSTRRRASRCRRRRSSSSGRRTATARAPAPLQHREVLADVALQREHADRRCAHRGDPPVPVRVDLDAALVEAARRGRASPARRARRRAARRPGATLAVVPCQRFTSSIPSSTACQTSGGVNQATPRGAVPAAARSSSSRLAAQWSSQPCSTTTSSSSSSVERGLQPLVVGRLRPALLVDAQLLAGLVDPGGRPARRRRPRGGQLRP